MRKEGDMCELSCRARAFSVEALIGVKRHRTEETGKNRQSDVTQQEEISERILDF
jgi:hypothetical protein